MSISAVWESQVGNSKGFPGREMSICAEKNLEYLKTVLAFCFLIRRIWSLALFPLIPQIPT